MSLTGTPLEILSAVLAWSTGGFCAAKMLLKHPMSFSGAVSIGGYFNAEEDHSTGELFNHSRMLRNQNSPLWLLRHSLSYPIHLLIVTSKADRESWSGVHYADAKQAVAAAAGIPGVGTIVLPTGGHNFSTYAPTVGPALPGSAPTAACSAPPAGRTLRRD